MKRKERTSLNFGILTIVLLIGLLAVEGNSQTVVKEEPGQSFQPLLSITREGSGNIFPNRTQVYFRMFRDGTIEYETPNDSENTPSIGVPAFKLGRSKLSGADRDFVIELMERVDVKTPRNGFSLLEKHLDAVMLTTVRLHLTTEEVVLNIRNIRLSHPKGEEIYTGELVRLLRFVECLRPSSSEERIYGWDRLY